MTGKLDQPLGLKEPAAKGKLLAGRTFMISGLILFAALFGFFASEYFRPHSGEPIKQQVLASSDKAVDEDSAKTRTPASKTGIRKRPDLPVDENAPALQELSAIDNPDNPSVIPQKRPENITKRQVLAELPDPELIEQSEFGPLPVRSSDGLRPFDVYARQPDTEGNFGVARIILIMGGMGISQTSTEQAIRLLPPGVTFAFAPYGNSLSRWMKSARKSGHEILMQIPMEPFGYPQTHAGERSLLSNASVQANRENLLWSLGRITNYVGVMNYLGGKMLTTPESLLPVFEELSDRGLMFVDDGSIKNSVTKTISGSARLPYTRAHISVDSLRTRSAIANKLKELETRAKRTGIAIGVATAFPESITQIAKFLKDAKKRGLELTPVSAIATQPK